MTAAPQDHEGRMEWLRIVYDVAARTPVERVEREVAEACRRHRAQPRDVSVGVASGAEPGAPARLTVTTIVPASDDGRPREALLRDIETLLAGSVPGRWRRLTCDSGVAVSV